MPVIAAETSAGKLILHNVVEVSEAPVELHFPIAEEVVSCAETGCYLVSPCKANPVEPIDIGRQVFLVEPHTEIHRQTAAQRPGILHIEGVIVSADFTRRSEFTKVHRSPISLTAVW